MLPSLATAATDAAVPSSRLVDLLGPLAFVALVPVVALLAALVVMAVRARRDAAAMRPRPVRAAVAAGVPPGPRDLQPAV